MNGACYGSVSQPASPGSGGGSSYAGAGGNGGGLVQIVAGGNVRLEGVIFANGADATNSRAGGGSGGGVWIFAGRLSGSGKIEANGGAGEPVHGGGGGGGRISLQCGTNLFSGSLTARGGAGWEAGGAGTIFTQVIGSTGSLLVNNAGQSGAGSTVTPPSLADVTICSNAMVIAAGDWTAGNLTIASNGILAGTQQSVMSLHVAGALTVQPGGLILGDGRGYLGGTGPGAGHNYYYSVANSYFFSGGGYGGPGASGLSPYAPGGGTYGSQTIPNDFGSGGGSLYSGFSSNGGSGGGAIRLIVSGPVQLDGAISANGTDGYDTGGGGSGGSIYVTCPTIAGSGKISANGGNGAGTGSGGGGGGRIALVVSQTNSFLGTVIAAGGGGANWGGAGTVFQQKPVHLAQGVQQTSQLILDNAGHLGTNTPVQSLPDARLIVRNGAVGAAGLNASFGNLSIASNAWLAPFSAGYFSSLNISIGGDAIIQAGGGILLDSAGDPPNSGNSHGLGSGPFPFPCGGGGHGGAGGSGSQYQATGGSALDSSPTAPAIAGSGGGSSGAYSIGGYGGGVVKLTVAGTLQLDGTISVNGGNGSGSGGGGGAGGSVSLMLGALAGAGNISANGGKGVDAAGGGGGGGCIAIQFATNLFAGSITAYGGSGANYGGAGTIYLETNTTQQSVFTLDNNGHPGAGSLLPTAGATSLILSNGARLSFSAPSTLKNLVVCSNAWLYPGANLNVSGNVTVQPGGVISADEGGFAQGIGPGAGKHLSGPDTLYACSGAGHGGTGGNAVGNSGGGGITYDLSASSSFQAGSGGGGLSPLSFGGNGGGVVNLNVSGTLQVDGSISANGGDGTGLGGGGGSGGGISLNVGTLAGWGAISANGGSGANSTGGGGGGGRIAILFETNSFAGNISAYGGDGANFGGAGTIYLKANTSSAASVIVDNAGHQGADSSVESSPLLHLTVQNGGRVYASGSYPLASLLVASNASLAVNPASQPASLNLQISGDVTVQSGGVVSGDLVGYASNLGPGAGRYSSPSPYYGGGGGHGGYGGRSSLNDPNLASNGGSAGYDDYRQPSQDGSGGGGYSASSTGGSGGGTIQMTVGGGLQLDGTLSVNGGDGVGNGGGGAGGSLDLHVAGRLTGSGHISANGGDGADSTGGGGGGGIIAVNASASLFSGTLSACGGSGAQYGGAGIIYLQTNADNPALVIMDNGGHGGTNTPLPEVTSDVDLILRNGAVASQTFPSQTVDSLLIASNAWLTSGSHQLAVSLSVSNNAVIQAGGGIDCDAAGYAQNLGPGHGNYVTTSFLYLGSGGGHGGYGADSVSNAAAGGTTYDSTTSPADAGSGGGGLFPNAIGGSGGGYINLRVTGAFQLDGVISANGGNGSNGGGGGAGGGLNLNVGSLTGAGRITANGGNGGLNSGGGGGGGRIALNFNGNPKSGFFTGTVSAFGGGGTGFGGAGTIYYNTNAPAYGLLVLDNNNNAGTNTSFDAANMDVTIQNQAVGLIPVSNWAPHNLLIRTNGVLVAPALSAPQYISASAITIDAGGWLSADGAGYGAQSGLGQAHNGTVVSGGGHGGYGGGLNGGGAYDSIRNPLLPGSGGGNYLYGPTRHAGGAGGGALNVTAKTLTVNGRLSADGGDGAENAGGGSGGSLLLQRISQLAGTGVLSANGGNANDAAGAGGGGRIAVSCVSNNFTGQFSAAGGHGFYPGGAGTVYLATGGRNLQTRSLFVDNAGLAGTNTPLGSAFDLPTMPFGLNISGAAIVVPVTPLPILRNLSIAGSATLTLPVAPSGLTVAALNDINVTGNLNADYLGFTQTNGPGAGAGLSGQGAGGGYGGAGGDSLSGARGGASYGAAFQPVDFGSGGGAGANTFAGGSQGGGALRVSAGGTLTVNGNLSANGNDGWQDDSGGGAGGSIWITASALVGDGNISATGGNGDLFGGGGGGGGRIAIYALTNQFAGSTNAGGGLGAWPGADGTIYLSSVFTDFQVVAQSPVGVVSNVVSHVDLTFSEAVATASFLTSSFAVTSPAGPVPVNAAAISSATVRVSFPVQNKPGDYSISVATNLTDMFGQPLAAPYAGTFTIALPLISGTVTDTNGTPVAGATLQPDGGLAGATTDANGGYSIGVPPGWSGTVTPSLGGKMFVPGSLAYTNVTGSLTNQNYRMVPTVAPSLVGSLNATNLSLSWAGLAGVTYQAQYSTNLVDWLPYGDAIIGTNGPMHLNLPLGADPTVFFRLSAVH